MKLFFHTLVLAVALALPLCLQAAPEKSKVTLSSAEVLKKDGNATARVGKWHLVSADTKAESKAKLSHNMLTPEEKKAGWKLLFDGKKIEGWRRYGSETAPVTGWVVKDGDLHKPAGVRAGDIMTEKTYENFEFSWEWKLEAGGNNGVKYFIIPERKAAVGHEYQMIDDAVVKDTYSSNASFYLIVKPAADKPNKPMGEWNQSRLLVKGNHVEHWLNGKKVLEYECGSPEIMKRVPQTKFKKYPGFGKKVKGHLLLTDHTNPCWYRNVKIRELAK